MPNQVLNVHILLIEDDEDDFFILKHLISKSPYLSVTFDWYKTIEEARENYKKDKYDLIFVDYYLGKSTALDLLKDSDKISEPMIVLTGMNSREKDIEVMRAGASDYLSKEGLSEVVLERTIRYAIERKSIQEELLKESFKYKDLFDLSIDPIVTLKSDFSIHQVNENFCQLIECDEGNLGNKTIFDFLEEEEMNDLIKDLLDKDGVVKNIQLTLLTAGHKKRNVILSIKKFESCTSDELSYQCTIKDITKLLRIRDKLSKQEKISMSGKMARTIAHEIRNPLTNIQLSLSELKDSGEVAEDNLFVDIILRGVKSIDDIVKDFINSTKLIELNKEAINLEEVLEKALSKCEDRMLLHNIQLQKEFSATNTVDGDKNHLELVFVNLITNASEALKDKENPTITLTSFNNENGVVVEISDNGCGMDEETRENLFGTFFTRKTAGLGVGMSTVYNTMIAHDAHITVQSELNKGTTFSLFFD